jgi:hypothetical protein
MSYVSWRDVMAKYGGSLGFYRAIEHGVVDERSEDYQRFYVPMRHANVLLQDIARLLAKHELDADAVKDIQYSLAKIASVLSAN